MGVFITRGDLFRGGCSGGRLGCLCGCCLGGCCSMYATYGFGVLVTVLGVSIILYGVSKMYIVFILRC